MKITVCEMNHESGDFRMEWERLKAHLQGQKSDLVLLPEMIFSEWFPADRHFDQRIWDDAVRMHTENESWLQELEPGIIVLGARPVNRDGNRFNEAFVWNHAEGFRTAHAKRYLPDEEGFWEASWYHRGKEPFRSVQIDQLRIGFLICTELWFFQHARAFGQEGIHFLIHPRATGNSTVEKWLVAGRAAAVVSGAFCISSNRSGKKEGGTEFGGGGWIVDVLGITSGEQPFLTMELESVHADAAKLTYPRYVIE